MQKTKVTFEERETVVLKKRSTHLSADCPLCQASVELVTPEILAVLAHTSEREVFRLLEAGVVHFVETSRIYACPGCFERMLGPKALPHNQIALKGDT